MQTIGTTLARGNRCSLVRVQVPAHNSSSAHGFLYLAAVRDDGCQQEHRQALADIAVR